MSPADKEEHRRRIGLTVQQQEKVDALFKEMGQRRQPISTRMRDLYRQRHELLTVYNFDRRRERELRAEIMQLHGKMLQLHTDTDEKLRRIMTQEQFEKMQQMIREKMAQEGNRPRRGWGNKGRDH
jgi:periplasmic protein CpxP/Spy